MSWFAVRFGPRSFGVFDVFPDEAGREAHPNGPIAAAPMKAAREGWFEVPPRIEKHDVLAAKLGG